MNWSEAWSKLNADGTLVERPGQRVMGKQCFYTMENKQRLLCEAPVGVGKSYAYLIPMIYNVKNPTKRGVVSTETTTLQDQLYDKDLPKLKKVFGGFTFHSLKGRNWYLCFNRAPANHPLAARLREKNLGNGERRDVERHLGRRLTDDEWDEVSGEAEFCGQNKCQAERCYSARARDIAAKADIVVTNHAMLRTHAEMGMESGPLGQFHHLVVDEAHTLERVLVDGWGDSVTPYELYKSLDNLWKGLDTAGLTALAGSVQKAETLVREGLKSAVTLFSLLYEERAGRMPDDAAWRREQFTMSQQFLTGRHDQAVVHALDDLERVSPERFLAATAVFDDAAKRLEHSLESISTGKRKVRKAVTAARRLQSMSETLGASLRTTNGVVVRYGVPHAVIGTGWKAWKGGLDVAVQMVPLDVSKKAREAIWDEVDSVTLVSGTLRDETDGSFRYVEKSLGLDGAETLVVPSSFDYATNQLIYVTDRRYEPADVEGARFAFQELLEVIEASRGRALVLFTANAELEYAADSLRQLVAGGLFPHRVLVQERGASKPELVRRFMEDTSSVLLGTKSFFTGVDFPGESCSAVVLCKYPLPQFNALCKVQIEYWRNRGFPKWYEREALQVFKQAAGRLIRNETDRGVIAILDQRAADPRERISKLVEMEVSATGSLLTNNVYEMKRWLD